MPVALSLPRWFSQRSIIILWLTGLILLGFVLFMIGHKLSEGNDLALCRNMNMNMKNAPKCMLGMWCHLFLMAPPMAVSKCAFCHMKNVTKLVVKKIKLTA